MSQTEECLVKWQQCLIWICWLFSLLIFSVIVVWWLHWEWPYSLEVHAEILRSEMSWWVQKNHVWVSECGICYVYVKRDKGREKANLASFNSFGSREGYSGTHCTLSFPVALIFFKEKLCVGESTLKRTLLCFSFSNSKMTIIELTLSMPWCR